MTFLCGVILPQDPPMSAVPFPNARINPRSTVRYLFLRRRKLKNSSRKSIPFRFFACVLCVQTTYWKALWRFRFRRRSQLERVSTRKKWYYSIQRRHYDTYIIVQIPLKIDISLIHLVAVIPYRIPCTYIRTVGHVVLLLLIFLASFRHKLERTRSLV